VENGCQLVASVESACPPSWCGTRGSIREARAHWVRPQLVAQVGFTEWTRDDKLRHPRYTGLRTDKDPREVVRETH